MHRTSRQVLLLTKIGEANGSTLVFRYVMHVSRAQVASAQNLLELGDDKLVMASLCSQRQKYVATKDRFEPSIRRRFIWGL